MRTGVSELGRVLTLQLFQQMVLQEWRLVCSKTKLRDGDQSKTLRQRRVDVERSASEESHLQNLQMVSEPVRAKEIPYAERYLWPLDASHVIEYWNTDSLTFEPPGPKLTATA